MSGRFYEMAADFAAWLGRPPEFTCGDCERWRRCGLPPTADCPARAEQMERLAREGGRPRMRDVMIGNCGGWIYERR